MDGEVVPPCQPEAFLIPSGGGSGEAEHLDDGSGLIFKGSGFYITDYGKDGKGARKDPPAEGAAPKAEKSEKSESAPAKEAAAPKVEAPKPAAKTTPSAS